MPSAVRCCPSCARSRCPPTEGPPCWLWPRACVVNYVPSPLLLTDSPNCFVCVQPLFRSSLRPDDHLLEVCLRPGCTLLTAEVLLAASGSKKPGEEGAVAPSSSDDSSITGMPSVWQNAQAVATLLLQQGGFAASPALATFFVRAGDTVSGCCWWTSLRWAGRALLLTHYLRLQPHAHARASF